MNEEEQKIDEEMEHEDSSEDISFELEKDEIDEELSQEKLKKLRSSLKEIQAERLEYLTGWQRAKADYINLKKESEERFSQGISYGKISLAESMLPALDGFSMAMSNREAWESVDSRWRIGIEYIHTQLTEALASAGIDSLGVVGEAFDPSIHESIEIVATKDTQKDNTIESVIQKGYKNGTRIIRPARVKVYGASIE